MKDCEAKEPVPVLYTTTKLRPESWWKIASIGFVKCSDIARVMLAGDLSSRSEDGKETPLRLEMWHTCNRMPQLKTIYFRGCATLLVPIEPEYADLAMKMSQPVSEWYCENYLNLSSATTIKYVKRPRPAEGCTELYVVEKEGRITTTIKHLMDMQGKKYFMPSVEPKTFTLEVV